MCFTFFCSVFYAVNFANGINSRDLFQVEIHGICIAVNVPVSVYLMVISQDILCIEPLDRSVGVNVDDTVSIVDDSVNGADKKPVIIQLCGGLLIAPVPAVKNIGNQLESRVAVAEFSAVDSSAHFA